jgi:hypothetical protein
LRCSIKLKVGALINLACFKDPARDKKERVLEPGTERGTAPSTWESQWATWMLQGGAKQTCDQEALS